MQNKKIKLKLFILFLIMFFFGEAGKIQASEVNAASCNQSDVQAAINKAGSGDVVLVPAGECEWGSNASYLSVNKPIILRGSGRDLTIINISQTAGSWTAGTIRISSLATVSSFTIRTATSGNSGTAFSSSANGFRITDIKYECRTTSINGYFVYSGSYGLIDNCDITGGAGNNELIFARGPTNSWQTTSSIGGADNLFIENSAFRNAGYVSDCNSNSRCVLRYNTIEGPMKIDGHGKASNSPPRGVRHMEVYNNRWTNTGLYWTAIEMRGGSGVVHNNTSDLSGNGAWFYLTDYGYTTAWSNFGGVCQCPSDYPVDDQIGVGQDPKVAASEPMYLWNNLKGGSSWIFNWKSTSSCQLTCGTFSLQEVILENRDYYLFPKPGYSPFSCPHPYTGLSGNCNENVSGREGYNISSSDTVSPGSPMGLIVR